MNIDVPPEYIIEFLEQNFGTKGKFVSGGNEFVMPSLFVPNDYKCHMSVNTFTGLWQDFKTSSKGNFFQLVAHTFDITYQRAKSKVILEAMLREYPVDLRPKEKEDQIKELEDIEEITIDSYSSKNELCQYAWKVLFLRKLFDLNDVFKFRYFLGIKDELKDRLVIPYFDENKEVYFFQARSLTSARPKYINPKGVKSKTVLYPYDPTRSRLVVCEGPLDAISLQLHGVNATCTQGSYVSHEQAEQLAEFEGKIIMGYDSDEAGLKGIQAFEKMRKEKRMQTFDVCILPHGFKDWNEAHVKDFDLLEYVLNNSNPYNYEYKMLTDLNSL